MTFSARLAVGAPGGTPRILEAAAAAPQRWTIGDSSGGWLTVHHQLIGEGCFPGERLRTRITVRQGASALVAAVAATPLRAGPPSLAAVRITVEPGARLIYAPGTLIPHAGAGHASILHAAVHPAGGLAILQAFTAGRTAHESPAFREFRLRTALRVGDTLALDEDVHILPADWPGGTHVVASVIALGGWPPAASAWWNNLAASLPFAAAADLRAGGTQVRAILPDYTAARTFFEAAIAHLREAPLMKFCSSPGKLPETGPQEY
ncbi:MAG: hypothetical protein KatS3mg062_0606 [Tepidiforma sp.]|nr:MAG: hypothetical protein KatS3mg062_0606 [Tepidiforma sp.]